MSNYKRYYNDYQMHVSITFVTYKRSPILIQNIKIFRKSIIETKKFFDFNIYAISVLKDHCHIIISTANSKDIPKIIKSIKYNFSVSIPNKFCSNSLTDSAKNRREKEIWQRRYYDHIIRNEKDLYRHLDYIHYNSMKHYNIAPRDWNYSSFKNFVKQGFYEENWCNYEDKNKICELNLE